MYRDSRRLRVLLALLIATSFTLITVDYRSGDGTVLTGLRRGTAAVFGPVQRAVTTVVRPIGNALSTLGDLGGLNDENKRLKRENEQLKSVLRQSEDVRRQKEEMDKLLRLAGDATWTIVPARVVGEAANTFEWTAVIDAGSRAGVKKDMTVVNGDGLVGRVIEVQPLTSTILLAVDPSFRVAARIAGEVGTLSGDGRRPMRLTLIDPEATGLAAGLPVVTRGTETFIAGVPIGVSTSVLRERGRAPVVTISPYVRFSSLDTLAVIVQRPRDNPGFRLAPTPSPRPTPSPTLPPVTPSTPATPGGTAPPGGSATPTPTARRS